MSNIFGIVTPMDIECASMYKALRLVSLYYKVKIIGENDWPLITKYCIKFQKRENMRHTWFLKGRKAEKDV